MFSATAERRAQKLVALQFFVLAPYVAVESLRALIGGDRPDASWVGIGLRHVKRDRDADAGYRQATARRPAAGSPRDRRGHQNMLCAYLAGALLLGLLGNVSVGAWSVRRTRSSAC